MSTHRRTFDLRQPTVFGVTAILTVIGVALAAPAQAQDVTYKVLHSFTGGADGRHPQSGLIQGPDGTLFGTTSTGGNSSQRAELNQTVVLRRK